MELGPARGMWQRARNECPMGGTRPMPLSRADGDALRPGTTATVRRQRRHCNAETMTTIIAGAGPVVGAEERFPHRGMITWGGSWRACRPGRGAPGLLQGYYVWQIPPGIC